MTSAALRYRSPNPRKSMIVLVLFVSMGCMASGLSPLADDQIAEADQQQVKSLATLSSHVAGLSGSVGSEGIVQRTWGLPRIVASRALGASRCDNTFCWDKQEKRITCCSSPTVVCMRRVGGDFAMCLPLPKDGICRHVGVGPGSWECPEHPPPSLPSPPSAPPQPPHIPRGPIYPPPPSCSRDYKPCLDSQAGRVGQLMCCASPNFVCMRRTGRQFAMCRPLSKSGSCVGDANWGCEGALPPPLPLLPQPPPPQPCTPPSFSPGVRYPNACCDATCQESDSLLREFKVCRKQCRAPPPLNMAMQVKVAELEAKTAGDFELARVIQEASTAAVEAQTAGNLELAMALRKGILAESVAAKVVSHVEAAAMEAEQRQDFKLAATIREGALAAANAEKAGDTLLAEAIRDDILAQSVTADGTARHEASGEATIGASWTREAHPASPSRGSSLGRGLRVAFIWLGMVVAVLMVFLSVFKALRKLRKHFVAVQQELKQNDNNNDASSTVSGSIFAGVFREIVQGSLESRGPPHLPRSKRKGRLVHVHDNNGRRLLPEPRMSMQVEEDAEEEEEIIVLEMEAEEGIEEGEEADDEDDEDDEEDEAAEDANTGDNFPSKAQQAVSAVSMDSEAERMALPLAADAPVAASPVATSSMAAPQKASPRPASSRAPERSPSEAQIAVPLGTRVQTAAQRWEQWGGTKN